MQFTTPSKHNLVTYQNLSQMFNKIEDAAIIEGEEVISIDTETTGFYPYKGDRIVGISLSTRRNDYYINRNAEHPHKIFSSSLWPLFENILPKFKIITGQNIKFDMHFLGRDKFELPPECSLYDTQVLGRICANDLPSYSLQALTGKKDDLKGYMNENKLYTMEKSPYKKTATKNYHFDKVPYPILSHYAMNDSRITYDLFINQMETIKNGNPGPMEIAQMESLLIPILFEMERTGIVAEKDRVEASYEKLETAMQAIGIWFHNKGVDIEKKKEVTTYFLQCGLVLPKTDNGNLSLAKEAIAEYKHEAVVKYREYKRLEKLKTTYFGAILGHLSRKNNTLHCTFNQSGTTTGRMSCREPNLQNQSKEEYDPENDFQIRDCFIPRKNYVFVAIDYDQMEYRLMLDYAAEKGVIKSIIEDGLDVHTATGEMVGIPRQSAKTLNFMLLYGGGDAKLCKELFEAIHEINVLKKMYMIRIFGPKKVIEDDEMFSWDERERAQALLKSKFKFTSDSESYVISEILNLGLDDVSHDLNELTKATELKQKYFEKLPHVQHFISRVKKKARDKKIIKSIYGRELKFRLSGSSYKAPNHLIQGGCGDIVKRAMIECHEYLKGQWGRMLLQVHDEILFEIHKDHLHIVPHLVNIMQNSYKQQYIPLTCGAKISNKSWQQLKEITDDTANKDI